MFYLIMIAVAASRFLPHPPNVACVAALGLFAGCYLKGWRAYFVPLSVMLSSDLVGQVLGVPGLGFYQPVSMLMVYLGLVASVPLGRILTLAATPSRLWRYPATSVVASTIFFLVSNFGLVLGGWYPMSIAGLATCYTAAIPFYGLTIAGDLFFTCAVFGAWELSHRRLTASHRQTQTC